MRSKANSFLRQVKASTCCGPHNQTVLVLSKSLRALVCSAKLEQNFISWFTMPRNLRNSATSRSAGKSTMAWTLEGTFRIPCPSIIYPRYSSLETEEYTLFIVQDNAFFLKTIQHSSYPLIMLYLVTTNHLTLSDQHTSVCLHLTLGQLLRRHTIQWVLQLAQWHRELLSE